MWRYGGEFVDQCGARHALQYNMRAALEGQAAHRAAHAAAEAGAGAAVEQGSACEWKPKSKR
jgi:hypothetical protein